jgi:nitrite reductase (NADH) small subunit
MPLVKLAAKSELPANGEAKEFSCNDKVICVANVNGSISALDNVCVHRGGPLAQGFLDAGKIVCPWHGWQFDVQTGQVGHNPSAKTKVYPIMVEGDDVWIEMEG